MTEKKWKSKTTVPDRMILTGPRAGEVIKGATYFEYVEDDV